MWRPGMPQTMFFGYDAVGRCVKRWTGPDNHTPADYNLATYFYYDGWKLIAESDGPNALRYNIFGAGPDEVVLHENYTNQQLLYFHHYDARGHTIALSARYSGQLVEQYAYDAFGKPYFYNGARQELLNFNGTPRNQSNVENRFIPT